MRRAAAWAIVMFRAVSAGAQPPEGPQSEDAAAAYLARLAEPWRDVTGFRGTARLALYGAAEGTFNVSFGRVFPDKSRLEVGGPLGGTALVVTAAGGRFLAYEPAAKAALVGPDSAKALAAALGADLGGALGEVMDRLAGRVTAEASTPLSLTTADAEGVVKLSWRAPDGALFQELTAGGEPARPVNLRHYDGGAVAWDIVYDDWREVDGVRAPFAVTVKTADAVAELKVMTFHLNPTISDDAFATAPPEGTEAVFSLEGGEP